MDLTALHKVSGIVSEKVSGKVSEKVSRNRLSFRKISSSPDMRRNRIKNEIK